MLDVCLLGSGGMMLLHDRWLSSCLVRFNGKFVLIDCGEGTQIPFRLAGWGCRTLDAICFTHYHADHIAGLPGLLLTLANAGRTEPLVLMGPKNLEYVVKSITVISQNLPFQLVFQVTVPEAFPFRLGEYQIQYLPVDHNIACNAYSIEILRPGKFDVEKAKQKDVPLRLWSPLQKGKTIEQDGILYTPQDVLGKDRKGFKVTYCTDTRPISSIADFAKDSDLFICEGMYGDNESKEKARDKKHMIFSEAAWIAREANVQELWLTHFSPSMNNPRMFLKNARNIFPNTMIGTDMMQKTLVFEEEETE